MQTTRLRESCVWKGREELAAAFALPCFVYPEANGALSWQEGPATACCQKHWRPKQTLVAEGAAAGEGAGAGRSRPVQGLGAEARLMGTGQTMQAACQLASPHAAADRGDRRVRATGQMTLPGSEPAPCEQGARRQGLKSEREPG